MELRRELTELALGVVFLYMFCYNTSDYGKAWR